MTEFSKNRSECQPCQRANYAYYDNLSLFIKTDVSIKFVPKSYNLLSVSEFIIIIIKNRNITA